MDSVVTQEFLEQSQYNTEEILENENLFGRNFYMTGGAEEILHMLRSCEPVRPRTILDVGSGLGGPVFLMAKRYGALVEGIDLSRPMFELAQQRLEHEGLEGRVRFYHGDILDFMPDIKYDLIFSSNTFVHIHQTNQLLDHLRSLLSDGGVLLFGDYCLGQDGPEMRAYIEEFRYKILRMEDWESRLEAHGFRKIVAEDGTVRHRSNCELALRTKGIGAEMHRCLTARIDRIDRGQQRWCIFCYGC